MNSLYGEIVKTFTHVKSHRKRSKFQQFMMSEQNYAKKLTNAYMHFHLEETFVHEIVEGQRNAMLNTKAIQEAPSETQVLTCIDQGKLSDMFADNSVKEVAAEKSPSDLGDNGSDEISECPKRLVIVLDRVDDFASQMDKNFSKMAADENEDSEAGYDTAGCDADENETTGSDTDKNDIVRSKTGGNGTTGSLIAGNDTTGNDKGRSDTENGINGNCTGGSGRPACQSDKEIITVISVANGLAYVSRNCLKRNMQAKHKHAISDQMIDITELSGKVEAGLKKSGVTIELPRCQRNCGRGGIDMELKFLSPIVTVSSSCTKGLEESTNISQTRGQFSSSDISISSDSSDTSLTERPRKLRKRKAVDYYPTKWSGKFQVLHQSCPKKNKMATSIDPFLTCSSNRDRKKMKTIDESTEIKSAENASNKHNLTDNALGNLVEENESSRDMKCEFTEMENVDNSGSETGNVLGMNTKSEDTKDNSATNDTDNEFDTIEDAVRNKELGSRGYTTNYSTDNVIYSEGKEKEIGRMRQKDDCSVSDQSVETSLFQKIWGRRDPSACMELERDKLQFVTLEKDFRRYNDFVETESLPDIEDFSVKTEGLPDTIHDETDNLRLPVNENMKSVPPNESSNGCTSSLINDSDQSCKYTLRKKPMVDYLKTKIGTFGTDSAVKSKPQDSCGRKIQNGNSEPEQEVGTDFGNSNSNGATRKRHGKTEHCSEKYDGNECPAGHSLRKIAKIDYFATKIDMFSLNGKKDEKLIKNMYSNRNKKIDKKADAAKDESCKAIAAGENGIGSDMIETDITDKGRATIIGDTFKFNIDQNGGNGTLCGKYNRLDPRVTGDISGNGSDNLLIQNPFELDFSSPFLGKYCLQDLKPQYREHSEEDIFVSDKEESLTCSEKISLIDFSSAESNISPLKRVEDYEMLTRSYENLDNMCNKSRHFCSEDKTSRKDRSEILSVEINESDTSPSIGTGINGVSNELHSSVVHNDIEHFEKVQESKLKSSNSQQTTIDKFFPVIKVNESIQSSKARDKPVGLSSNLIFRKINDKLSKVNDNNCDIMDTCKQKCDTKQRGKDFVQIDIFVKESVGSIEEKREEMQLGLEHFKSSLCDSKGKGETGRFADPLRSEKAGKDREDIDATKAGSTSLLCSRMTGSEFARDSCPEIACERNNSSMNVEIERDVVFEIRGHMSCANRSNEAEMAEPDSTVAENDIRLVEKESELDSSEVEDHIRLVETENELIVSEDIPLKQNPRESRMITVDSNVTFKKEIKLNLNAKHPGGCKDMEDDFSECSKMNVVITEDKHIIDGTNINKDSNLKDCDVEDGNKSMKTDNNCVIENRVEDYGTEIRNKIMREENCGKEDSNKIMRVDDCGKESRNKTMTEEDCGIKSRNKTMIRGDFGVEIRNGIGRVEGYSVENGSKTTRGEDSGIENRNTISRVEGYGLENRNKIMREERCDIENRNKTTRGENSAIENRNKIVREENCGIENRNKIMGEENSGIESRNKTMRVEQCSVENGKGYQKQVKKMNYQKNSSTAGVSKKSTQQEKFRQSDLMVGSVVWGKFSGNKWWPALVVNGDIVKKSTKRGFVWLYWLSDRQISQVKTSCVEPFQDAFVLRCKQKTKRYMQKLMKFGIDRGLEICASRADVDIDKYGSVDAWVKSDTGFLHIDSERFKPTPELPVPVDVLADLHCSQYYTLSTVGEKYQNNDCTNRNVSNSRVVPSTSCAPCTSDDSLKSAEFCVDLEEDAEIVRSDVNSEKERTCFACGILVVDVSYDHPLFQGKICEKCKETLKESFYAVDDDGCSMFCGICGDGGNLYVCADLECGSSYCFSCVEKHTSSSNTIKIKDAKDWKCFLCSEYRKSSHGDLVPHKDWSLEVVKLFQAGDTSVGTDLHYLKKSGQRKIRVLSLFDGIGSGKVALDELGLDVDVYYASEISPDAMLVANFHHNPVQLGDVWDLNKRRLEELCPIDLVLAGPPCNDLSIVNPDRKGFNGTGILVWRFISVLKSIETICKGTNHVFWLMENTGSMLNQYKQTISKEFGMEPVVWDAKYFTGQRRARNFWGNIPGMLSTPKFCKQLEKDRKDLDAALISNCNRKAQVSHTRTITSCSNSLTVTNGVNNALVSMNGEPDHIWVQELERLFGFPTHYTDVGQLTHERRRRLIGKAWSVPVIKHLLTPLKNYFKFKDT